MICSQVRRKLSAFMDSELDGAASSLIEEHLDACAECLQYLHQLRAVDGLVQGLPRIDPSPDFSSRVASAVRQVSDVPGREAVSPASRMKRAAARLSEAVFSLFEPAADPATRTLDEFNDCPPLSMSLVYFRLLDQSGRG